MEITINISRGEAEEIRQTARNRLIWGRPASIDTEVLRRIVAKLPPVLPQRRVRERTFAEPVHRHD